MNKKAQTLLPHLDMASSANFHEDANDAPDTSNMPQLLLECNQTIHPGFSGDNLNHMPNPVVSHGKISKEVCDPTSNAVINYIGQILLEEDIDEQMCNYQEDSALQDTEKSFYDILGKEYPFSPTWMQCNVSKSSNTADTCSSSTRKSGSRNEVPSCISKPLLISAEPFSALSIENLSAAQFQKGAEEAMKFLPAVGRLFIGSEQKRIEINEEAKTTYVSENNKTRNEARTKKCSLNEREPGLSEAVARKQQAVSSHETERIHNLDRFLFCKEHMKEVNSTRETIKQEARSKSGENQEDLEKEVVGERSVDLNSVLIHCSGAVHANDYSKACELIKQIRKQSSPRGDPYQRLAHYLVDGLEARLSGTGSDYYRELLSKEGTVTDFLKAFRIYHAICPFLRDGYYFSNRTIFEVSKNATKVHIIDFGIHMGFIWPSFFESLSSLGTESPKIRITGIEFPEKGFRPQKLVEETGRRLSEYAQSFNIRLNYQGIASKWEDIRIEDLNIQKGETVIVNCLYRLEGLADETITMDCPRDRVLRMIKEIKPCVFIHGIINGPYSTGPFKTRFKGILSRYLLLFDMHDSTIPRDFEMRIKIERNCLSPKAINAIACEGSERVERTETYRQWHTRNLRAGFVQQPLDSQIKKHIECFSKELYHKEFVVDEDNQWLLLGWKGRILFALSTWKPNDYDQTK